MIYVDLYIYFVGIGHNLFIHSPTNVHFDGFQLFVIKSNLAINTSACLLSTWVEVSWWYIPVIEGRLSKRMCISIFIRHYQVAVCNFREFIFPSEAIENPPLNVLTSTWICQLFEFANLPSMKLHVVLISTPLTTSKTERLLTQYCLSEFPFLRGSSSLVAYPFL